MQELKFRKLIKAKLRVTKIPKIKLEDTDTNELKTFGDYYEFNSFLGAGGFGFVVSAIDKETKEMMALKVSKISKIIMIFLLFV